MLDKTLRNDIDNEIIQNKNLGIKLVATALLVSTLLSILLLAINSTEAIQNLTMLLPHTMNLDTTANMFIWLTTATFSGAFTIIGFLYPFLIRRQSLLKNMIFSNIKARVETLIILGNAIAKKDKSTNLHNYRVTIYSIAFAKELKIPKSYIKKLIIGSFLHDIGKIAIPDSILLKNGPLTEDEMAIMKTHVTEGVAILKGSEMLNLAGDVILFHHEKYLGNGYPLKISGKNIPKIVRIFTIVDVFDALTSERTYKPAFSLDNSLMEMKSESGKSFDPYFLSVFLTIAPNLYASYASKQEDYLRNELEKIIKPMFLERKS